MTEYWTGAWGQKDKESDRQIQEKRVKTDRQTDRQTDKYIAVDLSLDGYPFESIAFFFIEKSR